MELSWLEVTCRLSTADGLEAVETVFSEYFISGFTVIDAQEINRRVMSGAWDAHGFTDAQLAETAVELCGYLSGDEEHRFASLQTAVSQVLEGTATTAAWRQAPLADEDWSESWKEHHEVLHFGKRIQVLPSWLEPDVPEDVVIRIDPGMAFGTGVHETTELCARYLEELVTSEMRVLDVGCGSGILALVAYGLGAKQVEAMDNDPRAVYEAAVNAAANNAAIIIYPSDLLKTVIGEADLIVANIITPVILTMLPQVVAHLRPQGKLLVSGVLEADRAEVEAAMLAQGLQPESHLQKNEWSAILACKGGTHV